MAYQDPYYNLYKQTHASGAAVSPAVVFGEGTVPTGITNQVLLVTWSGTTAGTLTIETYNQRTNTWYAGEAADLSTATPAYWFPTLGAVVRLVASGVDAGFTCWAALVPGTGV